MKKNKFFKTFNQNKKILIVLSLLMISSSITFEILRLDLLDYLNNGTYYLKCHREIKDEIIEKVNVDQNSIFQNSEFYESMILNKFYIKTPNISINNEIPKCYFSDNLSSLFDLLNQSSSFRIQGRLPELDNEVIVEAELFNIFKKEYDISLDEITPIPLNFTFWQNLKYINLPLNISIVGWYSINDPAVFPLIVDYKDFNSYYSFNKFIFGRFVLGQEIYENMTILKHELGYFEPEKFVLHTVEIFFPQSQGLKSISKTEFLQELNLFLNELNGNSEDPIWLYDQESNILSFYDTQKTVTTYLMILQGLSILFFTIILILIDNYFLKLNNKQITIVVEELFTLGLTYVEIKRKNLFMQLRESAFQVILVTLFASLTLIITNFLHSTYISYDLLVRSIIFQFFSGLVYSIVLFINKITNFHKIIESKKMESNPINLMKELMNPISRRKKKDKTTTKILKIMIFLVIIYLFFIPESILLKNDNIFPGFFGEVLGLNYFHILPYLPIVLYILLPIIPLIIIKYLNVLLKFLKRKLNFHKNFFAQYLNKITSTGLQIRKNLIYLLIIIGSISISLINNTILIRGYIQESNQEVFGSDLIVYERSYLFDWRTYEDEVFQNPLSYSLLENINGINNISQTKDCQIQIGSIRFNGIIIDKFYFSCIDFNKTLWNKDRTSIQNDLNALFDIDKSFIVISQRIFTEYGGAIEQNEIFNVDFNKTEYIKEYFVLGYMQFIPGIDLNNEDFIIFDDSLQSTYTYYDDYEDEYISKYYIKLEENVNPFDVKRDIQEKYSSRIYKTEINNFKYYPSKSSLFNKINTSDIELLGFDIYMNFVPYLLFNQLLFIMFGMFSVFIFVFYINEIQNHKNNISTFINIGLSKKQSISKISKSLLKQYFYLTLGVVLISIFISILAYRVQYYIFFTGNIFLLNPFEIHTSRLNRITQCESGLTPICIEINQIYSFSFRLSIFSFTFLLLGLVYLIIYLLSKSKWFSSKVMR